MNKGDIVVDRISGDTGKVLSSNPGSSAFVLVELSKYCRRQYRKENLEVKKSKKGSINV